MEGKNCFRTRWTQEPIYSGGSIASLALPRRSFEHLRSQQDTSKELSRRGAHTQAAEGAHAAPSLADFDECLVMACGDSINVVNAGTGELVCSYTLPVEDVILHVDAVSVLTEDQYTPFGQKAMSRAGAADPREDVESGGGASQAAKAKQKVKRQTKAAMDAEASGNDVKQEMSEGTNVAETLDPQLTVPMGCYVACGTRSLQLYMFQIAITETVALSPVTEQASPPEEEGSHAAVRAAESTGDEAMPMEPTAHYEMRVLRSWTAAQQAISIVSFSEGGQFLISGSTDGGIKVWNAFHHHLTHNFRCPSNSLLQSIHLDPTESFLITGSFEGHISVFDFVGKTLLAHSRPHVQAVDGIALSDDGTHVYSIARDRRLSLQRLTPQAAQPSGGKRRGAAGGTTPWTLEEERAVVVKEHLSTAFFENGHTLHVGSMDGVVTTYHVDGSTNTGAAATVLCRSAKPPTSRAEEANEETMMKCILLCGRPKGTVRSPALKGFRVEDTQSSQRSALYIADAGYNIAKFVFDAASGQYRSSGALVGFLDQILDIKTLPTGCLSADFPFERVIVNNSKDVRLYGTRGCFSGQTLQGHAEVVMCCAVSGDGSVIATGGKDMEVRFWSTRTFQTVAIGVKGHTAEITSMCFNAKQADSYSLLFTIAADENLRLWDVGQHVLPKLKATRRSGDSGTTATATGSSKAEKASPAEFESRAGVNAAHAGPVFAIAVAPNDQYVATGGKDKTVNLWNITGKKIFKESVLRGHRRGISSLAFSPVDRVLASAANDGSVRLWSLVSLSCVKTLQVDKVAVLQVAFFNHGTQLVTGNAEGVLRVWAVAASEAVWASESHHEKIWALSVLERDGDTVFLSGAADGVLVCTEDYTAEEVDRIKQDREDVILKEQALANAIRRGEFTEAFLLALQLNHPRHLRQVLVKWCTVDSAQCEEAMKRSLLPKLSEEHTLRLLQFTREWITNSRHCMVASLVIFCFLGSQHFEELAKLPAMQGLAEPLLAYSHRHSQRQHELARRTYYIDFVIQAGIRNGQRTLTSMPPFVNAAGKRLLPGETSTAAHRRRQPEQPQPPAKKVRV